MAKLGSLVGALGVIVLFIALARGSDLTTGIWILVAGLVLLIIGFFRGETKR